MAATSSYTEPYQPSGIGQEQPYKQLRNMTKLLIFIGEGQKFEVDSTIDAIVSMAGTTKAKRGNFIGAVFECEYRYAGESTVIRISCDAETVTAEGLHTCSLSFAVELQKLTAVDLHAIDLDYSFNVALRDFQTVESLARAVYV